MASTFESFNVGMFLLITLRVENLDEIALSCLVKEITLMLAFLWEIVNFKMVTSFYKTSVAVYINICTISEKINQSLATKITYWLSPNVLKLAWKFESCNYNSITYKEEKVNLGH